MIRAAYDYLAYDYQRFTLDRIIAKWRKKRDKEIAEAKQNGKGEAELREIRDGWHYCLSEYYDKRDLVVTRHWLRRARKYDLREPRYDEPNMWDESRWFYERTLTLEGIEVIRKAWREEISWRVTTFSGVGGLAVAAGGLLVAILSLAK